MWRDIPLTVGVCAVLVAAAAGQTTQSQEASVDSFQQGAEPPSFVNLSGFSEDYRIGPGDLLDIQLVGHPDLSQTLRISNSGEISYPTIGLIPVVDLTAFEVEGVIAALFRSRQLLQDPEVLVTVREYQAKPIYVSGAVVNPGQFIMSQELTVVDAVLLARGLLFNSADEALLHRRVTSLGQRWAAASIVENPHVARAGIEILKVDLRPLKEGRFADVSLPLRQGDVLVVPEQAMTAFFVVGEVVDPRNFFHPPQQTLMASQAISQAGGPLPTAKMSSGMLVRYDGQGRRTEKKVDYDAILRGRQADFSVQPNDIIFIPGSRAKTLAYGMLQLTDQMTMSTAFRIGRTYQLPDASDRFQEGR